MACPAAVTQTRDPQRFPASVADSQTSSMSESRLKLTAVHTPLPGIDDALKKK